MPETNTDDLKEKSTPAVSLKPDFRIFLQNEFLHRCRLNPNYSLRAFAKSLKTDPSTLSQIIRGKRRLTANQKIKFGLKLQLSPQELARFQESADRSGRQSKNAVQGTPFLTEDLTEDSFQMIADWYHYAIFELVTVKDFVPTPKWIASRLSLQVTEVQIAIERLFRAGILREKNGRWIQGAANLTTTTNPFTSAALRKHQTQILQKAINALEEISMDLRDQSSMTMAIPRSLLPQAKYRIREFRRELCKFLQGSSKRDSVYQLGISFYPLTTVSKEK